jgi:hypothetical protein
MEGIVDGRVADDCFVCALLWTDLGACPSCGGGMRWLPATMGDELDVLARVARGWDTWRATDELEWLEQLLEDLYRFAPGSLDALVAVGGDLDELRRAWRAAAPELSPDLSPDLSPGGHDGGRGGPA